MRIVGVLAALSAASCEWRLSDPGADAGRIDATSDIVAPGDAARPIYRRYTVEWSMGATFVDACALPGSGAVLRNADDSQAVQSLPFIFTFYNTAASTLWLSSNGYVAQREVSLVPYGQRCTSRSCDPWNNAIFAYHDDLQLRDRGICFAITDAPPARRAVATWSDVTRWLPGEDGGFVDNDSHITFSLLLTEGSDAIEVLFGPMSGPITDGTSYTGVRSASCDETDFACHTGLIREGARARFTPVQ